MSFQDIKGQGRAAALLAADFESKRMAESYLFVGPEDSGKREMALEVAKALNCTGQPAAKEVSLGFGFEAAEDRQESGGCGRCEACRKISESVHPDVVALDFEMQAKILDMDDDKKGRQKEFRIEVIRSLIRKAQFSPAEGRKRVTIIDGAEKLNEESANALLKNLEESSGSSMWILLSANGDKILPTIRSRCRKVSFAPPSGIASGGKPSAFLEMTDEVLFEKAAPDHALKLSARVFAERKRSTVKKQAEEFLNAMVLRAADSLKEKPSVERSKKMLSILAAKEDLNRNVSPQMVLDSLFINLMS